MVSMPQRYSTFLFLFLSYLMGVICSHNHAKYLRESVQTLLKIFVLSQAFGLQASPDLINEDEGRGMGRNCCMKLTMYGRGVLYKFYKKCRQLYACSLPNLRPAEPSFKWVDITLFWSYYVVQERRCDWISGPLLSESTTYLEYWLDQPDRKATPSRGRKASFKSTFVSWHSRDNIYYSNALQKFLVLNDSNCDQRLKITYYN